MKKILLTAVACLMGCIFAYSQTIPETVEFKNAAESTAHDGDALYCADFILASSGESLEFYKASAYVLAWISATDYITVSLGDAQAPIMKNTTLFSVYLAALAKNTIETKRDGKEINPEAVHIYSMNAVLDYYLKNKGNLGKVKALDKYSSLRNDGKLDEKLSEEYRKMIEKN